MRTPLPRISWRLERVRANESAKNRAGCAVNFIPCDTRVVYRNLVAQSCSFLQVPRTNLDLQQASANRDGNRVRSVVRSELVNQVLDVEVDSRLGNSESVGNLLVAVAVAY